jgi:hypothetical protein
MSTPSVTDQIREKLRVRNKKASLRSISLATGVQRVRIKRFLGGKEIHSSTLDKLAAYLRAYVRFRRK